MVTIYIEKRSPRVEFIFNHLFKRMLGCPFTITSDEKKYLNSSCPVICYAKNYTGKGIHIVPHRLLFEKGTRPVEIEVSYWEDLPIFFRTLEGEIPFDLFAASFYLITRYEEYLEEELDKHGRYPAEKSLAFRHNFLTRPIVDQWAIRLKKIVQDTYPEIVFNTPRFQFIPTIDVDSVYAYRHKGPFINGYHLLKEIFSGKFRKAKHRLLVILRQQEDPFFNFGKVTALHQDCGTLPIFFFHCGGYGKYDKKTFFPSYKYRDVKKDISRDFLVGLHPSYRAAFSLFHFRMERKKMESCIMDKSVSHNRFHYLRFRVPESYLMLSREGIAHDWSMGYSNYPGFRAGTSFPFRFYNLHNERTYKLMVHPFTVMDKTLKMDLGLNEEESKQYMLDLAQEVKAVNGTFVTLFHNENLTDAFSWKGWRQMYRSLLKEVMDMC